MIKRFLRRLVRTFLPELAVISSAQENMTFELGRRRIELMLARRGSFSRIRDAEVQVTSQWGEDGIIQYLLSVIATVPPIFIEFGVENYRESNTRFLLQHNKWKGLVFDGSKLFIDAIRADPVSWRNHLDARWAFITRENINNLIRDSGYVGEIGLLSVDIDGNDYWVLEAIEAVNPVIIIAEYNGLWGSKRALTVPYTQDFVRGRAHHSNLYYGASLPALISLCAKKGYDFVGSNSAGSNAFFVRSDRRTNIAIAQCNEEYIFRSFREGRNTRGELTFAGKAEQLQAVAHLPLVDVASGETGTVAEFVRL